MNKIHWILWCTILLPITVVILIVAALRGRWERLHPHESRLRDDLKKEITGSFRAQRFTAHGFFMSIVNSCLYTCNQLFGTKF
jgi:hypothetical protein